MVTSSGGPIVAQISDDIEHLGVLGSEPRSGMTIPHVSRYDITGNNDEIGLLLVEDISDESVSV